MCGSPDLASHTHGCVFATFQKHISQHRNHCRHVRCGRYITSRFGIEIGQSPYGVCCLLSDRRFQRILNRPIEIEVNQNHHKWIQSN